MTSAREQDHGQPLHSEAAWLDFATEAAARMLTRGGPRSDLRHFGRYLRQLRRRRALALDAVAAAVPLPMERLALLEQGLLDPNEIGPDVWVRLVNVYDGREELMSMKPTRKSRAAPSRSARAKSTGSRSTPDGHEPAAAAPAPERIGGVAIGVARIKVIGVGGGGSNAVARMYRQRVPGVEYVVVNTDSQHLLHIDVPVKLRIGDQLTRGLGVGGDPEVGRRAAVESREQLEELVAGTDMVFIACGMGGGTGTGAAPLIAEVAKASGVLTIAAVTKPFSFEGRRRMRQAEEGIGRMREHVDTLLIIPNDRLSTVDGGEITAENAFRLADDVLRQGVQSITELITVPGEINLDFADVKTVMRGAGPAWMAIGYGRGEDRAVKAAKAALESPLLDIPVEGATRVLLNIAGNTDLTLHEVHRAADYVARMVDPDANIIFGVVTDTRIDSEVRVTVIATGIRSNEELFNEAVAALESQAGTAEPTPEEEPPAPKADAPPDAPTEKRPSIWRRLGFGRPNPDA